MYRSSALFIVASPLHRALFNNWGLSEALSGRMTMDINTVHNVRAEKGRREMGIGLITVGEMKLLSSKASYAAPFSIAGLDPGPMMLLVLTSPANHHLMFDQDGAFLLSYDDGKTVQVLSETITYPSSVPDNLLCRPYNDQRFWYICRVSKQAGDYLLA